MTGPLLNIWGAFWRISSPPQRNSTRSSLAVAKNKTNNIYIETLNKYDQTKSISYGEGCWFFFKSTCLVLSWYSTYWDFPNIFICIVFVSVFFWSGLLDMSYIWNIVTAGLIQSQQKKGERLPCCLNKLGTVWHGWTSSCSILRCKYCQTASAVCYLCSLMNVCFCFFMYLLTVKSLTNMLFNVIFYNMQKTAFVHLDKCIKLNCVEFC